jgi:hypothetical protein
MAQECKPSPQSLVAAYANCLSDRTVAEGVGLPFSSQLVVLKIFVVLMTAS